MNSTKQDLHIDRSRRMFLGVCSGFGKYFGIAPIFLRIALLIAIFSWLPTILVYFVCYFLMNKDGNSIGDIKSTVSNSKLGKHFRSVNYKKPLYKNSRNRRIAGVCSGLADYFEISSFFIRLAFLGSLFFGFFPILAYFAAAILMDKNPIDDPSNRKEKQTYFHENPDEDWKGASRSSHRQSNQFSESSVKKQNFNECITRFSELEKKLRRLEAAVTSKKFKLHCELNRMSNNST